ncbi:MAG: glycosyltransferase family 4 protein [Vicinamibacterales bacterium]
MIAPQPFFEPRGTPFSEYHRIRALVDLGHSVDLVTYPFGKDVELRGLRVFRSLRPPFVRGVRVGPSLAKVALDIGIAASALRVALRGGYDAVHSHEEGAAIGVLLARLLRVPHVYDMHSSLPQQLANFKYSRSRAARALLSWVERLAIRGSRVVIVICPQLEAEVRRVDAGTQVVLIENAPGSGDPPREGAGSSVRAALGIPAAAPLVLYTGTLEAYQGLDLLFEAAARVISARPETRFVLVGGRSDLLEAARRQAEGAGLGAAAVFTGERPSEEIPAFLDAADVLVSPRSAGTNTPLKIYQYLRSGKPIVATRLLTHTQVLDDSVAVLVEPTAAGVAEGILAILADRAKAQRLGGEARRLAAAKYSYEAYLERTRQAYDKLAPAAPAPASAPEGVP